MENGCKRLHYELSRRHALRDDAPTHPEAVPFVAELVEDGELEVRQEALALMRSLEQLTGEELMH